MQEKKLSLLKKLFQISKPPTRHCKICFKEIKINDVCRLFNKDICICLGCQKQLNPKFIYFNVDGYQALALYEYSEFIKKQIYLFKGCFDYEMKDIFLNLFVKEIKIMYSGYLIVPIPSYKEDDEARGFNHVVEVFKQTGLEVLEIIEKNEHFKQAEHNANQRKNIKKYLQLNTSNPLIGKKVLIVDDIYTTGSTIKAAINLVEKLNPKKIKILVLAKTKPKQHEKPNTN